MKLPWSSTSRSHPLGLNASPRLATNLVLKLILVLLCRFENGLPTVLRIDGRLTYPHVHLVLRIPFRETAVGGTLGLSFEREAIRVLLFETGFPRLNGAEFLFLCSCLSREPLAQVSVSGGFLLCS